MKWILLVFLYGSGYLQAQDMPQFRAQTIDAFPGGYSVCVADMNSDGLADIIGLSTNPSAFVWYENPSWQKHVISHETTENIDCAPYDIDHDGRLDIALQSDFRMNRTGTGGLVQWLKNPADTAEPWSRFAIWSEPTCHRIRWADFDGDGESELVNAPLMGLNATSPEWNVGARLQWFSIPDDPEQGPWMPHLIDDRLTVLHGLWIGDWDGDHRDDLLTASFEGVHLYRSDGTGGELLWDKTKLGEGNQSGVARGSSEVSPGRRNGDGHAFIAAIEPWHGNEVVVYLPPAGRDGLWERAVIDATFHGGHGMVCGDLNNNGADELSPGIGITAEVCTFTGVLMLRGKNGRKSRSTSTALPFQTSAPRT